MLTFSYTEDFDYPASAVFSRLLDLQGRTTWMKGIMQNQVTPDGPVRLGTKYFESGNIRASEAKKPCLAGCKSEEEAI